ncbi:MAG: hypothetical protein DWP95_00310 [Proteobacteria bacterium]|nr:MAG: hypothetical protein DWP95_00310 [Pseudomonadota bacterium]
MSNVNPIALVCLLLVIMLLAIALFGWIRRYWQLSLAACFILVGFIFTNGFTLFIPTPSLSHDHLQLLTEYFLLPVILADAAYRFNIHVIRRQPWRPMSLLLPHFFIVLAFAFLFMLWGLNHQSETSLMMVLAAALLIFISDLSPPNKTLSMLNEIDKAKPDKTRLSGWVQIESFVIGVLALMLFLAVARLTAMDTEADFIWPSVTWYWLYWLWALFGGVIFGFIWGVLGGLLTTNIKNYRINLLLLSVISWFSYLSSLQFFGVSGITALLTTVLIMNKAHSQFLSPREIRYMRALSRNLHFIIGFVIYGLIIYKLQIGFLLNHWFDMMLAVAIYIIVRAIGLYGFLPLMAQLSASQVAHNIRHVLFLSTTHSSLILLAVWLLPADIPAKESYEAMAIALVLFSLFVQRPHLPGLLQKLTPAKPIRGINLIKNR